MFFAFFADYVLKFLVFLFASICVYLLRAFLRYALRVALTCIQNAPEILVRIKYFLVWALITVNSLTNVGTMFMIHRTSRVKA